MRKYRKSLPNTTLEQFCVWLHEWIEAFNLPIQNQWGWSYPLDPPSCIDIVQGDPPYKIVVKRIQSAPAVIKSVWRERPSPEYPRGHVPAFRNDPPRRSETPPYNPVALEITISRVGKGIDVEVDCNDGHRLQLEKFAFALISLEGKGQSLAGIVERVQELSQSELTGIPSALRDAIDMEREQKLLALGLTADGKQPTTKAAAQTEIDGRSEPEVLPAVTKAEQPREDQQIKTTAVHYGVKQKGAKQEIATRFIVTDGKTYRKYRDRGWLLTDDEFRAVTNGKSIAQYWAEATGDRTGN